MVDLFCKMMTLLTEIEDVRGNCVKGLAKAYKSVLVL